MDESASSACQSSTSDLANETFSSTSPAHWCFPPSLQLRRYGLTLVQFAMGWWFFLDAVSLSANARPPADAPYDVVPVHVRFPDWIPGLCSTVGMIIVNLIDKSRLMGEDGGSLSFGDMGGVAWKARLFLFLGFAMMAGGLAGSVVCSALLCSRSVW